MTTFRNYWLANMNEDVPSPTIPGSWFAERGLPMIVSCTCCGMTMALPSARIDREGYTYCGGCAGE